MHRRSLSAVLPAAVALLAGCSQGSSPAPATTTTVFASGAGTTAAAAAAAPNEAVCHTRSLSMMTVALMKDGNLNSLPKLPDRSMGIPECKGLTTAQLDSIALQLQKELQPLILAAAASQVAKTMTP